MAMYYVDLPEADVKDKAQMPGAIKRLIAAGRINQQTQICPVGDSAWQPAAVYSSWWEEPTPPAIKAPVVKLPVVKAPEPEPVKLIAAFPKPQPATDGLLPDYKPLPILPQQLPTIDLIFEILGWLSLLTSPISVLVETKT